MPMTKSRHNMPVKTRFERFFVKGPKNECWIFLGTKNRQGYGGFRIGRKMVKAHRISYQIYCGEISKDLQVLHSCDNSQCVNPNHLSLGDNLQNQKEAWARKKKSKNHKLTPENVIAIRKSPLNQYELAELFGVNQSQISRMKTGERGSGIMLISEEN